MRATFVKTVTALALILCAAIPAAGYEPVVVIGVRATAGYGSAESTVPEYSYGPEIDVDLRMLPGERLYLAGWYAGSLMVDPPISVPRDESALGVLTGGSFGGLDVELQVGVAASSAMGDDRSTFAPDWSAHAVAPVGAKSTIAVSYSGRYHQTSVPTETHVQNGADVELRWDPSLSLGLAAGFGARATGFADRYAATDELRRDLAAELGCRAEGLVGYFSFWQTAAAATIVRSNDPQEDRSVYRADLHLSTDPTSALGLRATASATASRYLLRDALDAAGLPLGEAVRAVRAAGSVDAQMTVLPDLFLVGDLGAVYGWSNDASLSGWSAEGSLAVQLRL